MMQTKQLAMVMALIATTMSSAYAGVVSEVLTFEGDTTYGYGEGLFGVTPPSPTNTSNNPFVLTNSGPSSNYGGFVWTESVDKTLQLYWESRTVTKPVGASSSGVISPDTSPGALPGATQTVWGTNVGSNDVTNTGIAAFMAPINVAPNALETSGNWVAAINNAGSSITFANASGFNFDSAFLYGSKYDEVITITATKSGGSSVSWNTGTDLFGVTDTFTDATHGTATFTAVGKTYDFGNTFDDVTSVTIQSLKGVAIFDNLVISAVPESSTYAMLLAGLGVIALIARRRKLAANVVRNRLN